MNQSRKILIATGLYPPDIGGPATYSKLLADELPARGFDIEVLSFGEVRHLPKIVRHFAYFFKAIRRARGADVIYAQDPVSVGLPACLAAFVLRKKFLLKVVGDYAWEQQQQELRIKNYESRFITPEEFQTRKFGLMTELRRRVERGVARRAEKIIVPSEYLKKIVKMWGIKESKIEVIYNAFEAPEVVISKEKAREQFGFSGTVLVSAGRLVPWKGFGALIETMSDILRGIPNAKLYIIGEGPEREALELKIKNYELSDRVFLLGKLPREELLKYLAAADIFVLNTGYEGLSHQILEAMALGAPIITTSVGGNTELIKNDESGILVSYNDKKALTEAVLKLLNNRDLGKRLTQNAKEKTKEFGKEKMLSELIEVFDAL